MNNPTEPKIKIELKDKFNWVKIYPLIAKELLKFKNDRSKLIKFLTDKENADYSPVKIKGGKSTKGTPDLVPITDIDPFSFFALFNRDFKKRSDMVVAVVNFFNIQELQDLKAENINFAGIPVVMNMSILFFPRDENDNKLSEHIGKLWYLFEESFNYNGNEKKDEGKILEGSNNSDPNPKSFQELFNESIKLTYVDNMLTTALYWIHPNKFIPYDTNSRYFYYQFFLKDNKEDDIQKLLNHKKRIVYDLGTIKFEGYEKIREIITSIDPTSEKYSFLGIENPENKIAVLSNKAWEYDFLGEMFNNKNIIFYGPPGTGKTYKTLEAIKLLTQNKKEYFKLIQFHPSFSYEDFIEGIKPMGLKDGQLKLELCNGVFKDFCIKVHKANKKRIKDGAKSLENYYFVVDEINRGNLSNIFGEMFFCIENNYRFKYLNKERSLIKENNKLIEENLESSVSTQYSLLISKLRNEEGEEKSEELIFEYDEETKNVYFGVPENIYFIGMMNDVDKSVDAFDLALRRRFSWIVKGYNEDVVKQELAGYKNLEEYLENIKTLNKYISDDLQLGPSYMFGHSFFLKIKDYCSKKRITSVDLEKLFDNHLRPTLREYLRSFYPDIEIEEPKGGYLSTALLKFTQKIGDEDK